VRLRRHANPGSCVDPTLVALKTCKLKSRCLKRLAADADKETMPTVPSIKGSVFTRAVEDILKLVSAGTLARGDLERRLRPADVALLDQPVISSGWYDVMAYGRLLDLLRDVEGNGSNEYLRERGARSADALRKSGLYQQMEYLSRTQAAQQSDPEARFLAFGRDLRLITTLHRSIVNFGQQQVREDPEHSDRYVMEYVDVAPFPESLCWTTHGFVNRIAKPRYQPDLWRWERPVVDLIVFRMIRSL